jgi:AraC-like DNA-binding protein
MDMILGSFPEPTNYLKGVGFAKLPIPFNILFFRRTEKKLLQQDNLKDKSHHRIVILINFATSGWVHLDHLEVKLSPNQAIVVHPHQFHHFSHLDSIELNWLVCTFELDSTAFIEPLRNKVINLSDSSLSCLQEAFSSFINRIQNSLSCDALQALLLTFLIRLKQDESNGLDTYSVMKDDLVSKVNRVLAESKNLELSVGHIAEKVKLSESRTRTIFKAISGVSLGQYILNYKIHVSLALLSDENLSVSEVAHQAGFASIQAFSRAFKQQTGQSPTEYRSKM